MQGGAFDVWLFHMIKHQHSRNDNKRCPKGSAKSVLLFDACMDAGTEIRQEHIIGVRYFA